MEQEKVQASIITIGDELMIGQVIDTNSAWIARELNALGIWVRRRVSVGDQYQEMWQALKQESAASKVVLITGGLGPTADDITKPFLCDFFQTRLVTDPDVLRHVQQIFERSNRPFTERNRRQAEVPEGCTVIHNERGTAPGMMFERNGVLYVSMPGVPHEMKGIMEDFVLPMLRNRFFTGQILHRTMLLAGIGESFLADHIQRWEESLPAHFKLAYLPNQGLIRLRLTATGDDVAGLLPALTSQFDTLKSLVSEWLVIDEDVTMGQAISLLLRRANKTLATAESCTGGYIAHLITREAGASAVYKGTVVSYANEVKTKLLSVPQEVLATVGAVSEETVIQMARAVAASLDTDYAIATSGIMGPDGGTPQKPVGTVWLAVGTRDNVVTQQLHLRYDRLRNIEMTAHQALNMLRRFLQNEGANTR